MDRAVARMRAAAEAFAGLRGEVEQRAPWPLAERFGTEPEASWGPPEVLAHVTEMLPYWLGEIERVLAGGPEPVPFGRVATDPIRTMTVDRDRTLPIGELYARLDAGVERVGRRLLEIDDRQAAKLGLHARRGEMTVEQIVDVMLAGHLEEHCEQLAKELEKPPQG